MSAEKNAWQRAWRRKNGNAATKRCEKTKQGYLMRSYRNMKSRVDGVQKKGSWTGKELMPRAEFYAMALADPEFHRLFAAYESSGFERRLAPSPDRVDSRRGHTPDNIRWVTHSVNSGLANKARVRAAG